jgi:hypothetical protein
LGGSADLSGADLHAVRFDLNANQELPAFSSFGGARNLASIEISFGPQTIPAFQQLREDLKKAGLRDEERGVTAALQRAYAAHAGWLESGAKFIAFDFTSEYGNSPGKPVYLMLLMLLLLAAIYAMKLKSKNRWTRGGIWKVWHPDRLLDAQTNEHELLYGLPLGSALRFGLWFSVLSSFHIGWRDLNVGNWLARIQSHEYALRPTGWVRTVSGGQSLLSVYLLALSILTYFGRPFE